MQAQPVLRTTGALTTDFTFQSYATAMSPDGSTVVGYSRNPQGGNEAFRWTLADGIEGLGDFSGGAFNSRAVSVSSNGVIVGYGNLNGVTTGFRLIKGGEMEPLPEKPDSRYFSQPWGISADSNTIVGESGTMLRWRGVDMQLDDLLDPPGGMTLGIGRAVSGDGSVIVGYGFSANGTEAFRWTQEGGYEMLGDLPGGQFRSEAYAVSDDGTTVVGYSESSRGSEAFRWTKETGMVNLGKLVNGGTYTSKAVGVSADGSLVVGVSDIGGKLKVVVWDEEGEVYDIEALLGTVFQLSQAVGISKDGDIIAGWGWNPQGRAEGFIIYGVLELMGRTIEIPNPWPSANLDEESGWMESNWFGWWWQMQQTRWAYHGEHGWIYPASGDESSGIYIYDTHLQTWLWVRQAEYPWVYSPAPLAKWLYYVRGGAPGGRWFYTQDGHWVHESELMP